MSRKDKLLAKLRRRPKDFTWDELSTLLISLGYKEAKAGKTGGSRKRFVHPAAGAVTLHKPHPRNILKMYVVNDIINILKREGMF